MKGSSPGCNRFTSVTRFSKENASSISRVNGRINAMDDSSHHGQWAISLLRGVARMRRVDAKPMLAAVSITLFRESSALLCNDSSFSKICFFSSVLAS